MSKADFGRWQRPPRNQSSQIAVPNAQEIQHCVQAHRGNLMLGGQTYYRLGMKRNPQTGPCQHRQVVGSIPNGNALLAINTLFRRG